MNNNAKFSLKNMFCVDNADDEFLIRSIMKLYAQKLRTKIRIKWMMDAKKLYRKIHIIFKYVIFQFGS